MRIILGFLPLLCFSLMSPMACFAQSQEVSNAKEAAREAAGVLSPAAEQERRVPFVLGRHNIVLLQVRIENRDITFILDTGSSHTFVDAKALKLAARPQFSVQVAQANQSTRRGVYALELKLERERISGQFIEIDLTAARQECMCEAMGLLGMDVVSRYASIEINFRERAIKWHPGRN